MLIRDCKINQIVIETNPALNNNSRIGHIIGFTYNSTDELIVIVNFAEYNNLNGCIIAIHAANIELAFEE